MTLKELEKSVGEILLDQLDANDVKIKYKEDQLTILEHEKFLLHVNNLLK